MGKYANGVKLKKKKMSVLKEDICCICQRSNNTEDILLYPVPKAKYRRKKWITTCGKNFVNGDRVCEFHFMEKDFRIYKNQRMIKLAALPTLNMHGTSKQETKQEVAPAEVKPDLVIVEAPTHYELINEELFDDKIYSVTNCSKAVQTGSENSRFGLIELDIDTGMYSINCLHCLEKLALTNIELFVTHVERNHNILQVTKQKITDLITYKEENSSDLIELKTEKDTLISCSAKIEELNSNAIDVEMRLDNKAKVELKEEIQVESEDKDPMWSDSKSSTSCSSVENEEEYVPLKRSKKKRSRGSVADNGNDAYLEDKSEIIIGKTNHGIIMDFLELLKLHPVLCIDSKTTKLDFDNGMENVLKSLGEKWPNFKTSKTALRRSIMRVKHWYKSRLYPYKKRSKIECRRQHRIYFDKCAQILTMSVLKGTPKLFSCNLCESIFLQETDLQLHRYMQHSIGDLPYACTQCAERFESLKLVARHMRDVHKIVQCKPFVCPECSNSYNSEKMLQSHMRRKHTGNIDSFVCDVCGKSFPHLRVLNRHRIGHEPPRLECSICKMRFVRRQNLNEHLKTHFNQRDQICTICGTAFVRRRNLRQHYKVHSNTEESMKCHLED